ncbi:ATP-binding cassette domain-containing protein [Bacillus pacificus]
MATLAVDAVSVGYNEGLIIDGLTVEIPEGKITTIIGPNGCGKSTLLKTASRILKAKKVLFILTEKQSRNNQRKKSQRKWQFYHRLQKCQLALLYLNSFHMDAFLIKRIWNVERRGLSLHSLGT